MCGRVKGALVLDKKDLLEHVARGVAAAISIVHQHPASGHLVTGVILGHGQRRGGLLVTLVVVAIRVSEKKAPKGRQDWSPSNACVQIQDLFHGCADEEEGVKPGLVMREHDTLRKIIPSRLVGIAQHSVALGRHVERRRVGAAAGIPTTTLADENKAPGVVEVAILHAAAIEALPVVRQGLPGTGGVPSHRLQLLPDHRFSPVQRQQQRVQRPSDLHPAAGKLEAIRRLRELRAWRCSRKRHDLRVHGVRDVAAGRQAQAEHSA